MTHPDYRNQGLSFYLIQHVLQNYKTDYDVIYLFANRNALNFYPRFGFQAINETQFVLEYYQSQSMSTNLRQLNLDDEGDLSFISSFVKQRIPVGSKYFSTDQADGIFMFYCLNVFQHDLYYIEDQDVIVIYKISPSQIDVFDIVSQREINLKKVLESIAHRGMNRFVFHFTPNIDGLNMKKQLFSGSEVLFVYSRDKQIIPIDVKHPITSQA